MKKLLALLAVLALGTQVSFAADAQKEIRNDGVVRGWRCHNTGHKNPVKVSGEKATCPKEGEHK